MYVAIMFVAISRDPSLESLTHLHAYSGVLVDRVQVVDQLGEILDRVDVVVGRGRDKSNSLLRCAEPSDVLGDFRAWKLSACN